jgi:hypothetical protein
MIVLKILLLKIVLIMCLLAEESVPKYAGIKGRVSTQLLRKRLQVETTPSPGIEPRSYMVYPVELPQPKGYIRCYVSHIISCQGKQTYQFLHIICAVFLVTTLKMRAIKRKWVKPFSSILQFLIYLFFFRNYWIYIAGQPARD